MCTFRDYSLHLGEELLVLENSSEIDVYKTYTMVESEAFYEAYRHVLAGLQGTRSDVCLKR